jgi:membrane-associated phospholipid phosphatase
MNARTLRPIDFLTLFFILFLLYLTLLFHLQIPRWQSLVREYVLLILILALVILAVTRSDRTSFELIHSFYPVTFIAFIFNSLSRLIPYVNPHAVDPELIRIDYFLFRSHPAVILEKITFPLLTELSQLAYTSYYFLPTILAVLFYRKKEWERFDPYVTTICFTYYLSYAGYILFPAIGPRFTLAHLQHIELRGLFFAERISNTLNLLEELKYDAFPSGHTAVILVTLYFSSKYSKKIFFLFLIPTLGLIFSTVYCRYHYVIDVLAGIALTCLCLYLGPKVHVALKNHITRSLKT